MSSVPFWLRVMVVAWWAAWSSGGWGRNFEHVRQWQGNLISCFVGQFLRGLGFGNVGCRRGGLPESRCFEWHQKFGVFRRSPVPGC